MRIQFCSEPVRFFSVTLKPQNQPKTTRETCVLQICGMFRHLQTLSNPNIYLLQLDLLSYRVIQMSYLVIHWDVSLAFFDESSKLKLLLLIVHKKRHTGKISDWFQRIRFVPTRFWRSDTYLAKQHQTAPTMSKKSVFIMDHQGIRDHHWSSWSQCGSS